MKPKKYPKADLEKKKVKFFQIGMIITLAAVWMALEWRTSDISGFDFGPLTGEPLDEQLIPITERKVKPPPLQKPPDEIFKIVDDDKKIEKEFEVKNTEVDISTRIKDIDEPEDPIDNGPEIPFLIVEEMPSFGTFEVDRLNYIAGCIKYPQRAKDAGIEGIVFVGFVINKKGEVTQVKVLRGIGGGCDEEAVRCIKSMPKWKPGKQRGKAVPVQMSQPVKFVLN